MAESGGGEEEEEVRLVLLCSNDENSSIVSDLTIANDQILIPIHNENAESLSTLTLIEMKELSDDIHDRLRHGSLARFDDITEQSPTGENNDNNETELIVPISAESVLQIEMKDPSDEHNHHHQHGSPERLGVDENIETIVSDTVENAETALEIEMIDSGDDQYGSGARFVDTEDQNVPIIVMNCPITDDSSQHDENVKKEQEEEEEEGESRTVMGSGSVQMVKKVMLPTRYNPFAIESPSTSKSRSSSSSSNSSSSSSVLRTLLQASGKQLMLYQTHKHNSERIQFREGTGSGGTQECEDGGGGDGDKNGSGESELSRMSKMRFRLQPRRKRPSSISTKYSVGSQTFPAGIHNTKFGCDEVELGKIPEGTSSKVVSTSGTSLLSRQLNSQIKALLLGHDYIRDERKMTTATVPCQEGEERRKDDLTEEVVAVVAAEHEDGSRIEDSLIKRRRLAEDSNLPVVISDAIKIVSEFNDLSFSVQHGQPLVFLEVRRKGLYGIPSPGTVPAQVVIDEEGYCRFLSIVGMTEEVHCLKSENGELSLDEVRPLLYKLSIKGGHVFCPGVKPNLVDAVPNVKNIMHVGTFPQRRYQSKDCPVWYMLSPSQSWLPLNRGVHTCKSCKQLERYLWAIKTAKAKRGSSENTGLDVGNAEFLCVWGSSDGVET